MDNIVILERPATPAEAEAGKPFPGILPSIGWIAAFLILQLLAGFAALGAAVAMDGGKRPPTAIMTDVTAYAVPMIWSLVIAELFLLFLMWLYLRKGERMAAVRLDRWSQLSLPQTLGMAVLLIGAGLAFNWAYGAYIVPDVEVQADLRRLFAAVPDTLPNSILLFVTIAVVAPLVEELLFRGFLQNSLSKALPTWAGIAVVARLFEKSPFLQPLQHSLSKHLPTWAAIALSALIFGAMHMDLYAMPPLVLMGAIFGVLYHLTGSLRVTIVLHMINNAAALALG